MKGKQVLGRGLDALIHPKPLESDTESSVEKVALQNTTESIHEIPVAAIEPNPLQPRRAFDAGQLKELTDSIRANGLVQPITVRRIAEKKYQIISGERRWRAFKELGREKIPAYVRDVQTDAEMIELALIENLQREDLNPIETAKGYAQLIETCQLTQDQVADKVGKERSSVSNTIRLLKLPPEIQQSLVDGRMNMGHAKALISITAIADLRKLWKKIIARQLSVREVEKLAAELKEGAAKSAGKQIKAGGSTLDPSLRTIQEELQRIFGTRVSISHSKKGKGTLSIEYYSQDEFERVIELMYDLKK